MNTNTSLKTSTFVRKLSINGVKPQIWIIFATILMTTIVSYWGTMKILLVLIAAFVAVLGLFFLLKYPNLGFIFILLGGWFVSLRGPGGFNASLLMVIFMSVLWVLDMFVVKRKFEFVHSAVLRPAAYFLAISVIAFIVGQVRWFSFANQAPLNAQLGGFAVYFFLVALMIVTANILHDIRWLKAFVWVFVGFGSLYILLDLANLSVVTRFVAPGAYVNSMFWTWLVALPGSQAVFNDNLKFKHRLALFAIVAITLYAGIQNSDWKSGWVPAAVTVGILLALRFKKLTLMSIPFAVIALVYAANALIATDEWSWGTRIDAWLLVLEIAKISPIIGLGFANYYWYAEIFRLRGFHSRFNSHSQFVDVIAQTGAAGLFCFMWIFFEVGRLSWRLSQKLPSGFERAYAYGVFAGIFGTLMGAFLGDWVLPFTYNIGLDGVRASVLPWIFFGALVAIEQMNKDKLISS